MATISFEVPEEAMRAIAATPEDFAHALRLAAAMYWYGHADITMGTAAELAGLSRVAFMRALKQAGQDTFAIDWDDFDQEITFLMDRHARAADGG